MKQENLLEYAEGFVTEFIRGMDFEAQMGLPSNLQDNIKAGVVKTKDDVSAYCEWYMERCVI